jgi:hypothetical protein
LTRGYGDLVLDLSSLDLEEIAAALADQTDYEHRWLINTETGEIVFWTSDSKDWADEAVRATREAGYVRCSPVSSGQDAYRASGTWPTSRHCHCRGVPSRPERTVNDCLPRKWRSLGC